VAHGGDIHHRNMPGKGCVFAISLPLVAVDADTGVRSMTG